MIYDCFPYAGEADILELRLSMLDEVIDKFVIVEGGYTQRGKEKEYFFEKEKQRFSKYYSKIIYVKVQNMPAKEYFPDKTIDFYINENFQRNCILRGLVFDCQPDDVIIVSDVDEIVNPAILRNMKNPIKVHYIHTGLSIFSNLEKVLRNIDISRCFFYKPISLCDLLQFTPIALEQDVFYCYMNWRAKNKWYGSVIVKYSALQAPQSLRNQRMILPYIKNGGWHFSYMGGVKSILKKISCLADAQTTVSAEQIQKELSKGIVYIDRYINLEIVDVFDEEQGMIRFKENHPEYFKDCFNEIDM